MKSCVWNIEIQGMPHAYKAMERIEAWFEHEVIDRAPIRFSMHNAQYDISEALDLTRWKNLKDRWFDAEYQVDKFIKSIEGQTFPAETFPVFWPNLGPEIYAAFFGVELEYGEITSWAKPAIADINDEVQNETLQFSTDNPYYKKIQELTDLALEKNQKQYIVGETCWCPGIDCIAAWRDPQALCMDLIMSPEEIKKFLARCTNPFQKLFDDYSDKMKTFGQPYVGWMAIPSVKTCHISQTDFANMISPDFFKEFCLPYLKQEISNTEHNIFHMDGKGVANHIDYLLELDDLHAIQWAQGVGDDAPIMQWVPLIRKIQQAGKSVVVDLLPEELDDFMEAVRPEGIFLCISADQKDYQDIIRHIEKWR